jgi:hypothetical protein
MNSTTNWLHKHLDISEILLKVDFNTDLKSSPDIDCTVLKDFRNVGSYNWCSDSTPSRPAIAVPGNPSLLKEKPLLQKLTLNKYARKADENKTNFPEFPIEPIYRWSIQSFNY